MFVVLHGETEWNRDGRLQGRADSPLTDLGKSQSATAARTLRELGCSARSRIVSSPLGRTLTTARIVQMSLDIVEAPQTDARLAELKLGAWEGLTRRERAAGWPGLEGGAKRFDRYSNVPGGESLGSLRGRLRSWLDEQTMHDELIVVTHGIAGLMLRGVYLQLDDEDALELAFARDQVVRLSEGTESSF